MSFHNQSIKRVFCKAVLCGSILAANGAVAEIEEIIVTAQKRAENLQEIPLTITAMSENDIENRGVVEIQDLFNTIPGVVGYEAPSARGNISINLRGVGSGNANSVSIDPANAVYVDGVFLGKASGNGVDAADLERIEVLKGPQGTLYGRNSTGGAINFITKKPQDEFGFKYKISVGNYDLRQMNARVDIPVADAFSVALSGYARKRDELYQNTRPGGEGFENIDRSGFRFAVQWHPSDAVTIDYSFARDELDENTQLLDVVGFNPMNAGVRRNSGFPSSVTPNSTDRITTLQGTLRGAGFLPQLPEVRQWAQWIRDYIDYANGQLDTANKRPDKGSNDQAQTSANEVDGHALTIAWNVEDMGVFGDVEFKSITGVREVENINMGDLDGMDNTVASGVISELPLLTIGGLFFNQISPRIPANIEFATARSLVQAIVNRGSAPVFNNFATIEHEQFSQELQMVGATDSVNYAIGFYFYEDESEFRNNRTASFPLASSATSSHDLSTESRSLYAQATWTPGGDSSWAFTGGLRYTRETKDITYLWRSSNNPFGFFGGPAANNYVANELAETQPQVRGIFGKTFEQDFNNLSGKITVQYFFNEAANIFATYSTGYRSGGFNGDFYDSANNQADTFNEETIKSFEVGVKSTLWDNKAQLNATVFAYEYDDLQISTLLPSGNSVTSAITNAGSSKREGLELSVKYAALDNLTFGLAYNHIRGDFDDFPAVVAPTANGGARLVASNLAERGLAPENQLLFNIDWHIYQGNSNSLELSVNGSWQDDTVPTNISTGIYDTTSGDGTNPDTPVVFQQKRLQERSLFNGRLAWRNETDNSKVTIALWGRNLLDEEYRSFGFNYGPELGLNIAQYGEPRTWGLDFIWEM